MSQPVREFFVVDAFTATRFGGNPAAVLPDDICFYRELPQVPLTDLPQLGGVAREAYLQMGADHPPHARTDVSWQPPL